MREVEEQGAIWQRERRWAWTQPSKRDCLSYETPRLWKYWPCSGPIPSSVQNPPSCGQGQGGQVGRWKPPCWNAASVLCSPSVHRTELWFSNPRCDSRPCGSYITRANLHCEQRVPNSVWLYLRCLLDSRAVGSKLFRVNKLFRKKIQSLWMRNES